MTFQEFVKKYNIADPYNKYLDTKYDYVAAWKSGATPDSTGHWPSQFKHEDSPERYKVINGELIDTKNFRGDRNMANNQKPQNLEDELAENDSVYQNNTSGGNTIFDKSIDLIIDDNDIKNSQDPKVQLNALQRLIKKYPAMKKGIGFLFKTLLGGPGQVAQNLKMADKGIGKGFNQYGGLGKQLPAVGRQIKKDILGEPHPAEYGGKASIYKGIVDEENRKYKKGGKVGKKYAKGGLLTQIRTLAINPK